MRRFRKSPSLTRLWRTPSGFRVLQQCASMDVTSNRLRTNLTVSRADSTPAGPAFHPLKCCSEQLQQHKAKRAERWVQTIEFKPLPLKRPKLPANRELAAAHGRQCATGARFRSQPAGYSACSACCGDHFTQLQQPQSYSPRSSAVLPTGSRIVLFIAR
jgi:hypothetical protein